MSLTFSKRYLLIKRRSFNPKTRPYEKHGLLYKSIVLWLIVTLLGGCTPKTQEVHSAYKTPLLVNDTWMRSDGTQLKLRRWLPDQPPHAVILGVHGFNNYSDTFSAPAKSWISQGIAVYAFDQRGFGTTKNIGIWAGTDVMVNDLAELAMLLKDPYPTTPLYIVGFSMGGAVTMIAMGRGLLPQIAGSILVAPATSGRKHMPFYQRATLLLISHTLPWFKVKGRGLTHGSDNISALKALRSDPLVIKKTRMDALYGLVHLMNEALSVSSAIQSPLLILYGENDMLVSKESMLSILQSLTAPNRFALYEKGYHMLLHDLQAEKTYQDIITWIKDSKAPLPSGTEVKYTAPTLSIEN